MNSGVQNVVIDLWCGRAKVNKAVMVIVLHGEMLRIISCRIKVYMMNGIMIIIIRHFLNWSFARHDVVRNINLKSDINVKLGHWIKFLGEKEKYIYQRRPIFQYVFIYLFNERKKLKKHNNNKKLNKYLKGSELNNFVPIITFFR